ncbi:MAG: inorganic phosphate transporter [Acidobacteria bacterium]|nr:inorganic phosphate transporter [Acidobacteriota bacterium]
MDEGGWALPRSFRVHPARRVGLPVSTTHVSMGAITGIAGSRTVRLFRNSLRALVMAWMVTPLVAGIISVATYLLAARLT